MGQKQLNVKIDDEHIDKFKAMCDKCGFTQPKGVEEAIQAWQVSVMSDDMPGRKDEIDEFQRALRILNEKFLNILTYCDTADGRIREEFKDEIKSYKSQIKNQDETINDLKSELEKLKQEEKEQFEASKIALEKTEERAAKAERELEDTKQKLQDTCTIQELVQQLKAVMQQPNEGNDEKREDS